MEGVGFPCHFFPALSTIFCTNTKCMGRSIYNTQVVCHILID